jgi:hypothetical protein
MRQDMDFVSSDTHWASSAAMRRVFEALEEHRTAVLKQNGIREYWRADTPLIAVLDCAPVHVSEETREIASHFPQIILIFIPPTFTGQLQALDVKFFGPFKQKLRGIQLNNWVKQFVHGTKETKIDVPSVKASRWNMLRSLHETLKESRPAAIATGEFMRSTS